MGASAGSDAADPTQEHSDEVRTPAAPGVVAAPHRVRRSGFAAAPAQTAEILDASMRGAPHRWNPVPRVPSHRGG